MCIIVDACKANTFVSNEAEAEPIWTLIKKNRLKIAVGGKLAEELRKTTFAKQFLVYSRAGYLHTISVEAVEEQEKQLHGDVTSNDKHVLALAKASGARLLYSADLALKDDFTKRRIIPVRLGSRGRIYRGPEDANLLLSTPACKG